LTKNLKNLIILLLKITKKRREVMKKLVSFLLSFALVGMIGLTAGCKKKEEAPTQEAPKVEAPAKQKQAPAEEKAAEKKPAEEKATEEKPAGESH